MAGLTKFKVGQASPANTFFAIWMAKACGLYEANGLDLEIVPVVGGKDTGPDLAAGKIDLMHIGMSSVVRANAAGGDVVTIGSLSNVIRNTMFTAPHVKTGADLKGGIIGISSAGSETDPTTTLALRKLGLKREDVTIKEIGVDRLEYVRSGAVAASLMGEPDRSRAFALGLNPIVDLFADKTPWLYSGLVVHRKFLREHRDRVLAFMKGTVEGNYLAVSDEKRSKEVLTKELRLEDPELAELAYSNFRSQTPMNADLTREGAKNIINIVATGNASRNIDDYMDASIFETLRDSGFFDAMKRKYAVS
jgi:ABC-type nitrate/sulfonate/bicarbonate transport system substrate-binding protein